VEPTIALVADFDLTLSSEYMQNELFRRFKINGSAFWTEKDKRIAAFQREGMSVNDASVYMQLMIEWAQPGMPFDGLTEEVLEDAGGAIACFPGIPHFLEESREAIRQEFGVALEHYIASSGLAPMVRGWVHAHGLEDTVTKILACEFQFDDYGVPSGIVNPVDANSKRNFVYQVNKGTHHNGVHVDLPLPEAERRIPLSHIVYIGDGRNDTRAAEAVMTGGGTVIWVHTPQNAESPHHHESLPEYRKHIAGRAHFEHDADYREGSPLHQNLMNVLRSYASAALSRQ